MLNVAIFLSIIGTVFAIALAILTYQQHKSKKLSSAESLRERRTK